MIYYERGKEKQMVKGSSWGHLQLIAWGSGGHLPAFSALPLIDKQTGIPPVEEGRKRALK